MPPASDDAIPLRGFYRVRPGRPGFAVPVFENNRQFVVQHVGAEGVIDGFVPCDVNVEQLLPAPINIGAEPLKSRLGNAPLYGFQMLDGTLICGSREKLRPLLRVVSSQLADHPFLSLEIAQFIEDDKLINESRARTQSLLRRQAPEAEVATLRTRLRPGARISATISNREGRGGTRGRGAATPLNWDKVQGSWLQFKGKAQQVWGDLTDDELDIIEEKREELVARLQAKYGYTKEEAEQEVDEWVRKL